MRTSTYFKAATVIGLCGTLFAGYLSGYKLFTSACAFNEPCPYVLGYPACWYGFAMFTTLFVVSLLGLLRRASESALTTANAIVSGCGILFAGYLTWRELLPWLAGAATKYSLVLPTCAYGLIFYIAMFALSAAMLLTKKR